MRSDWLCAGTLQHWWRSGHHRALGQTWPRTTDETLRVTDPAPVISNRASRWRRFLRIALWSALLLLIAAGGLLWYEMNTSLLQAHVLSELGREMTYQVEPGASDSIRFPKHGPFDVRLGYAALPQLKQRLAERAFDVSAQARISARMAEVMA